MEEAVLAASRGTAIGATTIAMGTNPITPPLFSHPEVKHNKAPAKIRFFNENAFLGYAPKLLGI
jgi:hypothetical protein